MIWIKISNWSLISDLVYCYLKIFVLAINEVVKCTLIPAQNCKDCNIFFIFLHHSMFEYLFSKELFNTILAFIRYIVSSLFKLYIKFYNPKVNNL